MFQRISINFITYVFITKILISFSFLLIPSFTDIVQFGVEKKSKGLNNLNKHCTNLKLSNIQAESQCNNLLGPL